MLQALADMGCWRGLVGLSSRFCIIFPSEYISDFTDEHTFFSQRRLYGAKDKGKGKRGFV